MALGDFLLSLLLSLFMALDIQLRYLARVGLGFG
jgi:hypothetical protein